MEHDAHPHAGAHVGGAGGQVAEFGRKGVGELGLEQGVDIVHVFPCGIGLEARAQGLDADMVLLVDHDGAGLAAIERDAAVSLPGGELLRDEMALQQKEAVESGRLVESHVLHVLEAGVADGAGDRFGDLVAFGGVGGRHEIHVREVPRQPDPGGDDDVGFGAVAGEPLPGLAGQFTQIHR